MGHVHLDAFAWTLFYFPHNNTHRERHMASRQDSQYSDFFSSFLSLPLCAPNDSRPFVTLTYAQSLDGRIAGKGGKQLVLSGDESMIMTHWLVALCSLSSRAKSRFFFRLRTFHDGILVGIGTALNDDPQLNGEQFFRPTFSHRITHSWLVRRLPPRETPYHLPQPIIMDTSLRFSPTCKLLKNFRQGTGRQPWLICSNAFTDEISRRREVLEAAGARVVPVSLTGNNNESLNTVLTTVRALGIQSLMVEGGQQIISSFLSATRKYRLIDTLIITVAPTFVGDQGISALSSETTDVCRCIYLYYCPTLIVIYRFPR